MYLSKSRYIAGMQCPKILWMKHNMPEAFDDSVLDQATLTAGNEIGDLAMGYFGDYTEVQFTGNKDSSKMIEETMRLLEADTKVICEASFSYEGNFCSVDILRRMDDGSFELIEVKSSSNTEEDEEEHDDGKIAPQYLHDMAYQYYVVTNAGYNVSKVFLMQLNKEYVRHGELDIEQLFVLNEATEQIIDLQGDIPYNIADMKLVNDKENEPQDMLGSRCGKPFLCGYKKHCWRDVPKNNIYDIGFRMWGSKKDEHYQGGIVTFGQAAEAEIKLSDSQWRQVNTVLYDLPDYVDKENIKEFLDTLTYPLYFLDFETIREPIPLWDGARPYMQIPFQYSLHILESLGGQLIHKEYLAKEGEDPRRELAEHLCADIPKDMCTLAYYDPFEKARIRDLARLFPDLGEHLMNIHDGIKDLIIPFRKGHFYTKAMGGSASIKAVLPAMFPNDPELNYKSLGLIQNGGDAMNAFPKLHEKSPEEIAEIRSALLAYCRLDTLAMVRILERLYFLVNDDNTIRNRI